MSRSSNGEGDDKRRTVGWVFAVPGELPPEWESRAQVVNLIPLLEGEFGAFMQRSDPKSILTDADRTMARLLARGLSTPDIARELGISPRSAERRIAQLRIGLGQSSKAELTAYLAERGFSL